MRSRSGIILIENNKLALIERHRNGLHYFIFPGGGIDEGEDRAKALAREVKEEVGSEIEVTGEVGKIIEYRSRWNLKQISYCYLGRILSKGKPSFTKKESSQGFKLVWLSLDDAISKVENDKPGNYEGSFIQQRDIVFLKKAKQIVRAKTSSGS